VIFRIPDDGQSQKPHSFGVILSYAAMLFQERSCTSLSELSVKQVETVVSFRIHFEILLLRLATSGNALSPTDTGTEYIQRTCRYSYANLFGRLLTLHDKIKERLILASIQPHLIRTLVLRVVFPCRLVFHALGIFYINSHSRNCT
jgi:hypothetical protein